MQSRAIIPALLAAAALIAGCDDSHVIVGGDPPGQPLNTAIESHWVFEGWATGSGNPVGYPVVDLRWDPPTSWDQEPFRVYGKRAGDSNFFLIATVTSCTVDGCAYRDRNVSYGGSYEYYVATVNEQTDEETASEFRETITVPAYSQPAAPLADSAVALDHAAYVRWRDGGAGGSLWKYRVFLTHVDAQSSLYQAGETDGTGYLDLGAQNGHSYGYRIAAVDTLEHVSALSPEVRVVPRPDASGELVYAFSDNAAASGFRFQTDEAVNPIVSGSATNAQWRLEADGTGWRIVPLNGTSVLEYPGRTTALACGPAADSDCRAATRAPAAGYQTTPIAVNPEYSYVFRVTGADGQVHYGVIRAQILGSDATSRRLMIFDWAYQLLPNDVRLNRTAG